MSARISDMRLGAHYLGGQRCSFLVWAPLAEEVRLRILQPARRDFQLAPSTRGYFSAMVEGIGPGARYMFQLNDGKERPDPASRFQPDGVHAASEVCEPRFAWEDQNWFGIPLRDYIIYELHVGTFTPEGTFEAIIPQLPHLVELGVTAIELMPVAQFPGSRNWGYDGVFPFAVQNSYGGPEGLKRLVNACHRAGLAVVLDVVYNHLGPEGNYLRDFGCYCSDACQTPWGAALNFDGEFSDEVRRFFIENALYWQTEFHIDALRLDAIHVIRDLSALPFLQELARAVRRQAERLNRRFYLIAESDLNDARYITPEVTGGIGLDAQWSDDFHHCLHTLITGERSGYYSDFGTTDLLAKVLRHGYAYTGEYSAYRKRKHGNLPALASPRQFVVYSQNHDQVGNRLGGDRLSRLADLESLKLAAGTVLFSPFIPLLFMGEEYGEPAPFQYIASHSDPRLVEAVRRGRREVFASFSWEGAVPDPFAESTFRQCVLTRETCHGQAPHSLLHGFYRQAIHLRKHLPALLEADKPSITAETTGGGQAIELRYHHAAGDILALLVFSEAPLTVRLPDGCWHKLLDSAEEKYGGPGSTVPGRLSRGAELALNPRSMLLLQQARPS